MGGRFLLGRSGFLSGGSFLTASGLFCGRSCLFPAGGGFLPGGSGLFPAGGSPQRAAQQAAGQGAQHIAAIALFAALFAAAAQGAGQQAARQAGKNVAAVALTGLFIAAAQQAASQRDKGTAVILVIIPAAQKAGEQAAEPVALGLGLFLLAAQGCQQQRGRHGQDLGGIHLAGAALFGNSVLHRLSFPAQNLGKDLGAILRIHILQKACQPFAAGVVVQGLGQAVGPVLGGGILRHGTYQSRQRVGQDILGVLFTGAGLARYGGDHTAGKQISQIHLSAPLSLFLLQCAEIAGIGAVGLKGFLNGPLIDLAGPHQGVAIGVKVVALAELRPVNRAVADGLLGFGQLLGGNRVKVDGEQRSQHQGNGCHYGHDLLGLAIQVLIGQQQDDNGQETNNGGDQPHVVPQEKLHAALLAGGVQPVGLFPQLAADDDKDKIDDQCPDEPVHFLLLGDVPGAIEHQNGAYLSGQGQHPQDDSGYTLAGGAFLIGGGDDCGALADFAGGSLHKLTLDLLFFCPIGSLLFYHKKSGEMPISLYQA